MTATVDGRNKVKGFKKSRRSKKIDYRDSQRFHLRLTELRCGK